jgi:hypothetical protein
MEIGKGRFEKFAPFLGSLVAIASLETLPKFTLRCSIGVAGRGWNKEKGQSKNPLVIR